MLGAIIGDIIGSRFEWNNTKSKEFELFALGCFPTDDSIMTLAVARALWECIGDYTNLSEQTIVPKNLFVLSPHSLTGNPKHSLDNHRNFHYNKLDICSQNTNAKEYPRHDKAYSHDQNKQPRCPCRTAAHLL